MTEVIVTGGLGFLGLQFAKRILRGGVAWSPLTKQASKLETLTLVDLRFPEAPLPEEVTSDPRVRVRTGDLAAPGIATELIESPDVPVVHLAHLVSPGADGGRARPVGHESNQSRAPTGQAGRSLSTTRRAQHSARSEPARRRAVSARRPCCLYSSRISR